jgi:hypothetical protein
MLAYVFWHHAAAGIDTAAYEESLRKFHHTLAAHAPEGFLGSAAFAFRGVPWFPAESGYLDWYKIDDFAGLGKLNDAAVAGARKEPHDHVARMAGAGFGGVFRLVAGNADLPRTQIGTWLRKPDGMTYDAFLEQASGLVDASKMGLWQRQMTLGPGLEFCLHSPNRIEAPAAFSPVQVELASITGAPPAQRPILFT